MGGFWDSKTRPRRPKMAPRWAKMAPRRPKIAPRRTKQAPRRPKIVPRKDGAETVQDAPKTFAKRDFKILGAILGGFLEAKARPRRSKMAGERSGR